MEGKADDFVTQMLPMYVGDYQLGKVGIHREVARRAALPDTGRLVTETRFVRAHREVDTTSYGDAYQQTTVISRGLDARVSGTPREVDLFALLLIHQGVLMQLEDEQLASAAQRLRLRASEDAKSERERALLTLYGKLGKKRRANLATSDPQVAALCARLEAERA